MGKGKHKKAEKITTCQRTIEELRDSRDGGQIALRGFSYQFLYSCFFILNSTNIDDAYQLEGLEDIDSIKQLDEGKEIIHIQLKYSVNKQNASFMKKVFENFLQVYLIDKSRSFKLVYDFPIADGKLKKLFQLNLDDADKKYWMRVIDDIKLDNLSWNWHLYDFDDFIKHIYIEKVEKETLAEEIEKALIKEYGIITDNISLFANSIKIKCLEEMVHRGIITKRDVDNVVQNVKIDISKGVHNPANSWIRRLSFESIATEGDNSFFEGKRATTSDIASQNPIRRLKLEKEVEMSIFNNEVTVIKSSSGQGKTTLALQCVYNLQKEYTPYQLLWCNEIREVGNIVQFFDARIRLGEKVLILIDNLDNNFEYWGILVQQLKNELRSHHRILITSRENDWFSYSGDLSKIPSIKIIKPTLEEKEAKELFDLFKKAHQLHPSIDNWKSAWNRIKERKLLIEYVYLLTHGTMIAERVAGQITQIGKAPDSKIKYEILRKVCLADICGIKVSVDKLCSSLYSETSSDYGELLKSLESEFFVHVDTDSHYIEGLHPVRSKHIFDRLHEFFSVDKTAISLLTIVEKKDLPIIFSNFAEIDLSKEAFCEKAIDVLWEDNDLSAYMHAIKGSFSGSVLEYYKKNKNGFITANEHGALSLISTEKCPYTKFKEFDIEVSPLDQIRKALQNNENIDYLCSLRDRMQDWNSKDSFTYRICSSIFNKLQKISFVSVGDVVSYAQIAYWMYIFDSGFALLKEDILDEIWKTPEKYSLLSMEQLMYLSFCINKENYINFINKRKKDILLYLKHQTKSYKLYEDKKNNAIHVEYILRSESYATANEQSVSRLKSICRMLPVYDYYCSDVIKPQISILPAYRIPDDAHKEIPLEKLVIMFHQDLTSLWNKAIRSNFELCTINEWVEYWFCLRKQACKLADKWCECIIRTLSDKMLGSVVKECSFLSEEYSKSIICEKLFPKEEKPFEDKSEVIDGLSQIKGDYFFSLHNFSNQFWGFLLRNEKEQRLAQINLMMAENSIHEVQSYFAKIVDRYGYQDEHIKLCAEENREISSLVMACLYYSNHFPDRYFDKFQIKAYYEKYCEEEMKVAEQSLSALCSINIVFPEKSFTIGVLKYYPIIIDSSVIIDKRLFEEFLIEASPFGKTIFDYLVLLAIDKDGRIERKALQFSKGIFEEFDSMINSTYVSECEELNFPYPVNVTSQMLDCFNNKYSLVEENDYDVKKLNTGDIAAELWIYSKLNDLSLEAEDKEYYLEEAKESKLQIYSILEVLKANLTEDEYMRIENLCKNVFEGKRFDDDSMNNLIERVIVSAQNRE